MGQTSPRNLSLLGLMGYVGQTMPVTIPYPVTLLKMRVRSSLVRKSFQEPSTLTLWITSPMEKEHVRVMLLPLQWHKSSKNSPPKGARSQQCPYIGLIIERLTLLQLLLTCVVWNNHRQDCWSARGRLIVQLHALILLIRFYEVIHCPLHGTLAEIGRM